MLRNKENNVAQRKEGLYMKWFYNINDVEILRKEYKKLVVKYHPDNGGSEEIIKEINNEYQILFKAIKDEFEHSDKFNQSTEKQKQKYDWKKDSNIRDTILQLSKFHKIDIEICGVWIWVSNGYTYKKELHNLGFHFAKQKKMWYIHFDDYYKYSKKGTSMNHIRKKYGSIRICPEERDEIKMKI